MHRRVVGSLTIVLFLLITCSIFLGLPLKPAAAAAPEISVWGNGVEIADEDDTPTLDDHTDFGNANVDGGTVVRTFTIKSSGGMDLTLTNGPSYVEIGGVNAGDFEVTAIPSSPIADGGNTTFQVTFNPSATGVRSANISIANDDADENPYNFDIQGIGTVAPVISNLDGDTVTFTEGGGAILLDLGGDATVTDADASGYNGGTVTVAIAGGGTANEDFGVDGNNVTSGGDAVITGGEAILVSGTNIGTVNAINDGQNGAILQIDLNVNATNELISELLQNITYNNDSDDPPGSRTVNFTVTDIYETSGVAAVTVNLVGVNDPPTLAATGEDPTFSEGGAAADLYSAVTISTIETGQTIIQLVLTITNVNDGAAEIMNIDGSDVTLTNGTTVTPTANNGMTVTVEVVGTTATVTIFKAAGISVANMQTLVDGMTYRNTSDNPNASNRVVTLTSIKDSGGTANGGADTTALAIASTVTVTPVNDAPVVSNLNGDSVDVVAGDGATLIDENGNADVTDVDSVDFNGGNLSINQATGTTNGNFGVDGVNVTSGGDATITAGETIAVGGVAIGTVHAVNDGQGGNDLVISLNANATPARVATLIRNITYAAPSGLGARTFNLTVDDGDGGTSTSVAATFTVNVNPNPPVITNLDGDTIIYDPFAGGEGFLDDGDDAVVTDPDSANFNGGNVTVTITVGETVAEDVLGISINGTTVTLSAGTTVGSTVSVGGVAIGTVTANGTNGNDLVVTFNANATPARVTTLLRALIYQNTNNVNPSLANRTIRVTVTDAGASAATSDPADITVNLGSPEINIQQSGTNIADGATFNIGNQITFTSRDFIFVIQNTGTGALTVSTAIIIGGANADQFSIQQQPTSPVGTPGTTTFVIRFLPTSGGVKTATITIVNNDIDENPYNITITGVGISPPTLPSPTPPSGGTITTNDPVVDLELDDDGQTQHTYNINSEDNVLNIVIPEGTIILDSNNNPVGTITVTPVLDPPPPPPGVNIIGPVFSLGPSGTTFDPPITITFNYDEADIPPGVAETDLQFAYYDETTGQWVVLDGTVDTVNNTITVTVNHFTDYAIIGETNVTPTITATTTTPAPQVSTPPQTSVTTTAPTAPNLQDESENGQLLSWWSIIIICIAGVGILLIIWRLTRKNV